MSFLPLHNVLITPPQPTSTAADAIASELWERQSACSTCTRQSPTQPPLRAEPDQPSPVVEVEFKGHRKLLCANPRQLRLQLRELVLVAVPTGTDAGYICALGDLALRKQRLFYANAEPSSSILRKATETDQAQYERNRQEELQILQEARRLARTLPELEQMKLTDAEWQWDRRRLTLYFTAPGRVDFRKYVRLLTQRFRARIELRQIQPREETRRLGGIGPCGRELCCSTFLRECRPVPLAAVRTQLLPFNLLRLSGLCGRLKCCLLYELSFYREALQHYPPLNATVHTEAGPAKIVKLDIFREQLQLQLIETGTFLTLSLAQITDLWRQGKVELPTALEPPSPSEGESLPPEEELA
ncbi:MAG: regulatory iron-sulfur-containing complex subunit RicT [Chlorobiota bacterium]